MELKLEREQLYKAGAVVVKDIPALGMAGGNPAKVFKLRLKEEYEKLKKENKINIFTNKKSNIVNPY